ncbi:MAG: helix-turn-helix transcriptional regulator [Candidatus Gastranaerophilales bacterium]|nr:helix-turn-helix transcriptional regulator [Candidatus Gastranaerophilales bacterium]
MNDNKILEIFGHNVKIERVKKSLSQQELAELTEFSVPYISNIEHGKYNISLTRARKISNFFKKTIDEMLKKQE